MSLKKEIKKGLFYLPIIRDIVAVLIGAYRGIADVINNPEYDKTQYYMDNFERKENDGK